MPRRSDGSLHVEIQINDGYTKSDGTTNFFLAFEGYRTERCDVDGVFLV
jgi:hypothetical protein